MKANKQLAELKPFIEQENITVVATKKKRLQENKNRERKRENVNAKMNLKRAKAFSFGEFDLGDDVIIHPENGNRNPGAPLIPERRHSTLNGDGASALGIASHNAGFEVDDSRGSGGICICIWLGGEAPQLGGVSCKGKGSDSRGVGGEELPETRNDASRGGRHY